MYQSRYMREMSERTRNEKPMTDEDWYKTLKYFDFKCAYCGATIQYMGVDMQLFVKGKK